MTPRDLFNSLIGDQQPTRIEVLEELEKITKGFNPLYTSTLISDFKDMLEQWKYDKTVERMKAEYNEIVASYEEDMHRCEYALAMGTSEPIEWPEEPKPFAYPCPGTYDSYLDYFIPSMYGYAVEVLTSHSTAATHPTADNTISEEFATEESQKIFQAMITHGYCIADGEAYRWDKTTALLAYFIDEVSRVLDLRPSNGRIPWSIFRPVFNLSESDIRTCRNEVSKYTTNENKGAQKDKPEGWRELDNLISEALR